MYYRAAVDTAIISAINTKVEAVSWWDMYYVQPTVWSGEWKGLSSVLDMSAVLTAFFGSTALYASRHSNLSTSKILPLTDIYNSFQPSQLLDGSKTTLKLCDRSQPNFLLIGQ